MSQSNNTINQIINAINEINAEQEVVEGAIMEMLNELGITEEDVKAKRWTLREIADQMNNLTPIKYEEPRVSVGRHPMYEDKDMLVEMLMELAQDINAEMWELIQATPGRSILLVEEVGMDTSMAMELLIEEGIMTKVLIILPTSDVEDFKASMNERAEERAEEENHECTNCGACNEEQEETVDLMSKDEVNQHIEAFLEFAIPQAQAGKHKVVEMMWVGLVTCMPEDKRFMEEDLFLDLQEFVKTLHPTLEEMDITVDYDMYVMAYDMMMQTHNETIGTKTKFQYKA